MTGLFSAFLILEMVPSDTWRNGEGDMWLSLVAFQRVSLAALFYVSIDELNTQPSLAYPVIVLNECIPILFDSLLGKYEIIFSWIAYGKIGTFGQMHLICRLNKHNSSWVHNKNTSDLEFIFLAISLCFSIV